MARKVVVGEYEVHITPCRIKIYTLNKSAIKWYITLCKFDRPVRVIFKFSSFAFMEWKLHYNSLEEVRYKLEVEGLKFTDTEYNNIFEGMNSKLMMMKIIK